MALITSTLSDSILWITFSDPSSRNSFSLAAARELRAAFASGTHRFDALVMRAEGRVFCSGGNLSDYAAMESATPGVEVNREIASVLDDLSKLPVPTFALVGGDCFGGGLELLSAFDFVHAAPHAYFGFWQRRIGLSFGWGGGARLERRLGPHRLRSLALSAATFGAQEALGFGLIDRIRPEATLIPGALEEVGRMATMPKAAVVALKTWEAASEQKIFEDLWWNEEHRAVLALRKPKRD